MLSYGWTLKIHEKRSQSQKTPNVKCCNNSNHTWHLTESLTDTESKAPILRFQERRNGGMGNAYKWVQLQCGVRSVLRGGRWWGTHSNAKVPNAPKLWDRNGKFCTTYTLPKILTHVIPQLKVKMSNFTLSTLYHNLKDFFLAYMIWEINTHRQCPTPNSLNPPSPSDAPQFTCNLLKKAFFSHVRFNRCALPPKLYVDTSQKYKAEVVILLFRMFALNFLSNLFLFYEHGLFCLHVCLNEDAQPHLQVPKQHPWLSPYPLWHKFLPHTSN